MPKNIRIVVSMEGGIVQRVMTSCHEHTVEVVIQDFDVEGADESEILESPNGIEYVGYMAQVGIDTDYVNVLFKDIEGNS